MITQINEQDIDAVNGGGILEAIVDAIAQEIADALREAMKPQL